MGDWEGQTSGAVYFREATFWEEMTFGLFLGSGLLKISEKNLGASLNGWATIGPVPNGTLHIHNKFGLQYTGTDPYEKDGDLMHTARHELSHVLDLKHEHQRWDRDQFLNMAQSPYPNMDGENFRLIKEFSTWGFHFVVMVERRVSFSYPRCSFSWRRGLRCSWATESFSIWVPEWRYIELKNRNGSGSAQFDCLSVMLYDGIPYRETPQNHCTQTPEAYQQYDRFKRTRKNIAISDADAATIAGRYAK